MTSSEAGRELGVGAERVRQLARRGELPALMVRGGIRLFKRTDVDRLKRERAKASIRGSVTLPELLCALDLLLILRVAWLIGHLR